MKTSIDDFKRARLIHNSKVLKSSIHDSSIEEDAYTNVKFKRPVFVIKRPLRDI